MDAYTLFKFLIAPLIVSLNLYVFCVVFVVCTTRSCYGIKMNNRLCLSAGHDRTASELLIMRSKTEPCSLNSRWICTILLQSL